MGKKRAAEETLSESTVEGPLKPVKMGKKRTRKDSKETLSESSVEGSETPAKMDFIDQDYDFLEWEIIEDALFSSDDEIEEEWMRLILESYSQRQANSTERNHEEEAIMAKGKHLRDERNKLMEKWFKIKEAEKEKKKWLKDEESRLKEWEILFMDTSKMTERQRQDHEKLCNTIREKHGIV